MVEQKRIHERKKIGEKKQSAKELKQKIELEEIKTETEETDAKEYPSIKGHGTRGYPSIKGQGTRYSCLYSTVRKKAGTTYSPKY